MENNQKYSEAINSLILKIQELAYQKTIKISDLSNLAIAMNKIKFNTSKRIADKNIENLLNSVSNEFSSILEKAANKKSTDTPSKFIKIIDKSINPQKIKTSEIQNELDDMVETIKKYRKAIDKASEKSRSDSRNNEFESPNFLAQKLELSPILKNLNPLDEELLNEMGAQKTCYVNYWGSEGNGSGFICSEDQKNLYVMTNKHVAFDIDTKEGKIIKKNQARNLEFEENSGIKLLRTRNIQYFSSDNLDMAILKIPKTDLEIKKQLYIPTFSPDLIRDKRFVACIGNSQGYGTSATFGNVKNNNYKMIDGTCENKINNFIESKLPIFSGNSGGPLFTCDIIENTHRKTQFNNFQIAGLNARADDPKYQAEMIEGYTEYDRKFDDLKRIYINGKLDKLIERGASRKEVHQYKESLEKEFKKLKLDEQKKLTGFDQIEDKYIEYKFNTGTIYTYSVPSPELIQEINVMKSQFPDLKNLNLKVAPSRESTITSSERIKQRDQITSL